jgi:hypothetical protein
MLLDVFTQVTYIQTYIRFSLRIIIYVMVFLKSISVQDLCLLGCSAV